MGLAYGLSIDGKSWEALYFRGNAPMNLVVLGRVGLASEPLDKCIERGPSETILKRLRGLDPTHPLLRQRNGPAVVAKAQGGTRPTVNELPDDLNTRWLCPACGGSGECPGCDGRGEAGGSKCGLCGGAGQCEECDGRGYGDEPTDGPGDRGPSSQLRQLVRELQQGNARMQQLGRRMFGGQL